MDFNLRGVNPEGLHVVWASGNFLPVLGIVPQLGRPFIRSDFNPESERTALVSHEIWRRRYGSDPAIIGSHVDLEGPGYLSDSNGRYTIVGILPERFWLFATRTDFVIPMRASVAQLNDPALRLVENVVARLTGPSPEVLRSDLGAISHRAELESYGSPSQPTAIAVTSLRDWHFGDLRRPLLFLMAAVVLVALTACANVALVLIARTTSRHRELAVRLAIGAGRGRIIRQLLTESLLLSLLGGLFGVCLAFSATGVVAALIPQGVVSRIPGGVDALSLDYLVLGVAVGASVLSGLLSGLGSLFASHLTASFDHLRDAASSRLPSTRLAPQALLVIAQTAVAVVLMVAGGLFLTSLERLTSVDLGIEPRPGLVVWLNLNRSRYPQDEDRVRFYRGVFEQLRAQSEVTHASGVDMPFHVNWQTTRFGTEENKSAESDGWPEALARSVSPTYFERHGIRMLQGRTFTELDDSRGPSIAIVSQTLADQHWPGRSAIGQQLRTLTASGQPVSSVVIGVVTDIRSTPHASTKPIIYRPFPQAPPAWMYLTVEGTIEHQGLLPAIRRAVWAVDPEQPLDGPSGPWTLQQWISARTQQPRLVTAIANALAAVGLLLAAIGLYGLLSYTVARRTFEFGVRMALGASPSRVMGLVLRRTLTLTLVGLAIGLTTAAFTTRFLGSMLFGVAPLDPVIFVSAGFVLLTVSIVAALVPVRRAVSVSPVVALHTE